MTPPATKTRRALAVLREYESRNVTYLEADGSWPIVWARARGAVVWDVEGAQYLDLTAAFGVAAAGHANPRVVRAGQRQMATLLHAMGDVHPHALKGELARELSRLTFERWQLGRKGRTGDAPPEPGGKAKTIFCNSGFEAVEAALKTACLATGKAGVIAFSGAYHGLGYGTLNATHREHFRAPFRRQLREFGQFAPFPGPTPPACRRPARARSDADKGQTPTLAQAEARIADLLASGKIGAVLVEPIQVRGGVNIPPPEFLPRLRRWCDQAGALLVLDEIYTGFGRTGKWFACEHTGVVPDLICLGKALTGGFPLSACVGRAGLLDAAWPPSSGEAIHTSTFLGHPVGCAMALAQIRELRSRQLVPRSARLGGQLLESLAALPTLGRDYSWSARGCGLLAGLDLRRADGSAATDLALRAVKAMLRRGFIVLPEGAEGNVLGFSPPLTITAGELRRSVRALGESLLEAARATPPVPGPTPLPG